MSLNYPVDLFVALIDRVLIQIKSLRLGVFFFLFFFRSYLSFLKSELIAIYHQDRCHGNNQHLTDLVYISSTPSFILFAKGVKHHGSSDCCLHVGGEEMTGLHLERRRADSPVKVPNLHVLKPRAG